MVDEDTHGEAREPEQLERSASEVVERGTDVREEVRLLTVGALSEGRLDVERARRVVDAVMNGVARGARQDVANARRHVEEATRGVDDALGHAAQAISLTTSEARERLADFNEEDLRKAREDLRTLEAIFADALARLARSSDAMVRDMWHDLEQHWKASGTQVGREAARAFGEAAEQLRRASGAQLAAGWDAALGASAQIASVASGVLAGIADTLARAQGRSGGGGGGGGGDEDDGS